MVTQLLGAGLVVFFLLGSGHPPQIIEVETGDVHREPTKITSAEYSIFEMYPPESRWGRPITGTFPRVPPCTGM